MNALVLSVVAGIAVLAIDNGLGKGPHAALLVNIIFFNAMCQGAVAIMAAGVLAKGKWNQPALKEVFSVIPMMLFCSVLFLGLVPHWGMYPWASGEIKTTFFQKGFFFTRNIIILLATVALAWKFGKACKENSEDKGFWAVIYVLAFVTCQSFIAFDWVMPLALPWFSTLFGAFYFVSAFYLGVIFCGFLAYRNTRAKDASAAWKKTHYDLGIFMYGFSVLWAYIFFSQLIVIWYGNQPETVPFFTERLQHSPYKELSLISFFCVTVVPFTHMIFQKVKSNPAFNLLVSLIIATGHLIVQYVIIRPEANIPLLVVGLEFVIFAFVMRKIVLGHFAQPAEAAA